jgi:hypothetical protein
VKLRYHAQVAAAVVFATAAVIGSPRSVAAECTYIPPLPKVSMAIRTAKELFVGDVIASLDGDRFTVRIVEVLRGPAHVGDRRTFDSVPPNWPWTKGTGPAFPACTTLHGRVGETVILALDARTSGMTLHEYGATWYQPPTTFSTVGIVNGSSHEQYGSVGRQLFSLERLRELARLSPPETDTEREVVVPSPGVPFMSRGPGLVAVIGLLLAVGGLWATRRSRYRRRAGAHPISRAG